MKPIEEIYRDLPDSGIGGEDKPEPVPKSPRFSWFRTLLILLIAVMSVSLLLPALLTGRLIPVRIVDTLNQPVGVTGWNEKGLILRDGRVVALSGHDALPAESKALREATREGVEIAADGRVFGLVRVHHWCGNDPVSWHVARVDLSNLLNFLAEGDGGGFGPGGAFFEHGWRVGEYHRFSAWENWKASSPVQ